MFTCGPAFLKAAGTAFTADAWSGTDKSANLSLSGSNRIVTSTSATDAGIRSAASKTSGKYYFEYAVGAFSGGNSGVGLADNAAVLATMGGSAAHVAIAYLSGNVYVAGGLAGSAGGALTGTNIGLAVDLDNRRVWFRQNGGNWNASGTSTPATPSTGFSISGLNSAIFPAVTSNANGNSVTANFGASAFAYSVPAGFTAGWPA